MFWYHRRQTAIESFLRDARYGVPCPKCRSHNVCVLYFDEKEPQNQRSFKCRIGLHDWSEYESVDVGKSSERQLEKHCKRCGKVQRRLVANAGWLMREDISLA